MKCFSPPLKLKALGALPPSPQRNHMLFCSFSFGFCHTKHSAFLIHSFIYLPFPSPCLSICSAPASVPASSRGIIISLQWGLFGNPHFAGRKTEAQRGEMTCLSSCSWDSHSGLLTNSFQDVSSAGLPSLLGLRHQAPSIYSAREGGS